MSMMKIRFVDQLPPNLTPSRKKGSKWAEAAKLMSQPAHMNQWALVDFKPDQKKAKSLQNYLKNGNSPFRSFKVETATRRKPAGNGWEVYARITGLKDKPVTDANGDEPVYTA